MLEGVPAPTDRLAEQRLALARAFIYGPGGLSTMPIVAREFSRITDQERRAKHESWTNCLFGVRPLIDPEAVQRRAAELQPLHEDEDDRLVLAEAEDVGIRTLLSFDADFIRRLGPRAHLNLTTPTSFWASLGVPKGAAPRIVPRYDNPLAGQEWWRW